MERKKVEKNVKDWASNLGFRLPSGSTLPPDFFAALGATPRRRQLWETIVELVQPRNKIELMRKEILAARLKGFVGKLGGKEVDRLDLWERQNKLETDVKDKRNEVSKLEKNILSRSSDLISESCKLAELEKQCDEYKEKILVLKLYVRKQKNMIRELDVIMKRPHCDLLNPCYQELNSLREEIQQLEDIPNTSPCFGELNKQDETNQKEENMWEDVIKQKRIFNENIKMLLEEMKLSEKGFLREMSKIEGNLHSSLTELKQKVTEEALKVMVNTKEGKMLSLKIEKITGKLEETHRKDKTFDDSFFTDSPEENKCLGIFTNYAKVLALRCYQDFLENELKRCEEEKTWKESEDPFEKYMLVLKSKESVIDEIHQLKLQKQELSSNILTLHEELQILLMSITERDQNDAFRETVVESTESLKATLAKQVGIFVQTPLDAFRKVETSSGRVLFECESLSHCLNNYGGELKEFFTAMLIPPTRNVPKIISTLEKRKKSLSEAKDFIVKWKKLVQSQKNMEESLSSIKTDSRVCDRNFKDAFGILWKISVKSEQIHPEINCLKKILKNWVEQPYRFMIKEARTVNGLTLKQYEAYCKSTQ